jgi:HPt (histidine-containing phosphotransfer) domain-containing protein
MFGAFLLRLGCFSRTLGLGRKNWRRENDMIASGAKAAGDNRQTRTTGALTDRPAIDDEHLKRMTLGDDRLEQEVLQIFVRQNAMMLERISSGKPGALAIAAHTLIGSARGIGAWRIAGAAERLERASCEGGEDEIGDAIAELKAASLEATAAIGARLAAPSR